MSPEKEQGLQLELADVYNKLSDIAVRQRALTSELNEVEGERYIILAELGRLSVRDWDVT